MQQYPGAKPHGGDPGTVTPYVKTSPSQSWSATHPAEKALTNARAILTKQVGEDYHQSLPSMIRKSENAIAVEAIAHILKDCSKTSVSGNFMANEDPTIDSGSSKFLKTAIINGTYQLSMMIDSGSSDCSLRHQVAERCNLQVVCKAQALYWLGRTDTTIVQSKEISEVNI
ncbi:hypothetical protein HPB51_020474 [Rhipicephalus microplus]|uniref:Uncharacterized protein n=1 Tax=Rhipicephalus microplus TaxID=6941 RepID=A0A9J6DC47_RHIMP|nr:hypothetical protein HPB51_020474 [Rhipicephalus microplus]